MASYKDTASDFWQKLLLDNLTVLPMPFGQELLLIFLLFFHLCNALLAQLLKISIIIQ